MKHIYLKEAKEILADKGIELTATDDFMKDIAGVPVAEEHMTLVDTTAQICWLMVDVMAGLPPDYTWQIVEAHNNKFISSLTCKLEGSVVGYVTINLWDDVVELRNERIRKALERKDYIQSMSADHLRKQIKRYFKPMTLPETLESRCRDMKRRMSREETEALYKWRRLQKCLDKLAPYIMENFDKYKPILKEASPETKLDDLVELYAEISVVQSVTDAPTTKVLLTDEYCVARAVTANTGARTTVWPIDEIPHKMRAQLGMLKLLDDETFAVGVGYKDRPDLFTLVGQYYE